MKYRQGYKYQLADDYTLVTPVTGYEADTQFLTLRPSGELLIRSGYAWDGPSGPMVDTENTKTPSLVHDAFYQLIRHGLLAGEAKTKADKFFYDMCVDRGMSRIRAGYAFWAIDNFGHNSSTRGKPKPILEAL